VSERLVLLTRAREFQEALNAAEHVLDIRGWMEGLDDYGPCPCFVIDLPDFRAKGHCWRTSWWAPGNGPCACVHVGLHVWGDELMGRRLADLLTDADWYGEWPLVIEAQRP